MLNILEILKKYQDAQKKVGGANNAASSETAQGTGGVIKNLQLSSNAASDSDGDSVSILSVVNKDISEEQAARALAWYSQAVEWLKRTYHTQAVLPEDFRSQCAVMTGEAADCLNASSKDLLKLCFADYTQKEDALIYHVVNVTIISLEIGKGLGYDQQRLAELGLAALLHDVGMLRCMDLMNKEGKLTDAEYAVIKEHPLKGIELLTTMGGGNVPAVTDVILQEHERSDGSGYPRALREDHIAEYAQLIGLVDVYEAMTHTRPYRQKVNPSRTINTMLNKKSNFSSKMLKVLLERIGVFPAGTWVRLNTKETGIVSSVNHGLPLRPLVTVLFDEAGIKLNRPRLINLGTNLLVCIEECLDNPKN